MAKYTNQLNLSVKYFVFIIYYLARPIVNILLYITHSPETNFYFRFAAAVVVVFLFILLYVVNYLCSSVSSAAHKSYSIMYSFLIRNNRKITTQTKLRIQNFIEKLSGPVIGIYCYDLFPMSNYEFYDFIASWAANYFLIIELL